MDQFIERCAILVEKVPSTHPFFEGLLLKELMIQIVCLQWFNAGLHSEINIPIGHISTDLKLYSWLEHENLVLENISTFYGLSFI